MQHLDTWNEVLTLINKVLAIVHTWLLIKQLRAENKQDTGKHITIVAVFLCGLGLVMAGPIVQNVLEYCAQDCHQVVEMLANGFWHEADCEDGGGPICNGILQLIAKWLPQADCEDGGGPICNGILQLIAKWLPQADCEDGGGPICNIFEGDVA